MTPDQRYDILRRFKGYGDLTRARIVYIGIEEHDGWTEADLLRSFGIDMEEHGYESILDRQLSFLESGTLGRADWDRSDKNWTKRTVKRNTLEGVQIMLGRRIRSESWNEPGIPGTDEEYHKRSFGEIEFQANLWPLGKSKAKEEEWDSVKDTYHKIFGVPLDLEQYQNDCIHARLQVLREVVDKARSNGQHTVTIIFGKHDIWNGRFWNQIRGAVFPNTSIEFNPKDRVVWSTDGRVCLAVQRSGANGLKNWEMKSIVDSLKNIR